jgi:hypothetical protein
MAWEVGLKPVIHELQNPAERAAGFDDQLRAS